MTRKAKALSIIGVLAAITVAAGYLARGLPSKKHPPAGKDGRPTAVILITVDTLRADRLSAYGYTRSRTPAIDGLAAEGALFLTTYCDIPWTTGSMASVMTGTYGPMHGLQFHWQRLPESRLTLAEMLKEAGFVTGAVVGSFPLDSVYGLDQGFDTYSDEFSKPMIAPSVKTPVKPMEVVMSKDLKKMAASTQAKMRNDAYRPDEEVTRVAINWLREHSSDRFFLWVHYFGPHERLFLSQPNQRERIIADYDRDLRHTDASVGRLLAAVRSLDLDQRSLVVFHSDHGQGLGEHGIVGHGRDLYEVTVRIPLIMRYPPGIPAGMRIKTVARNVDILPTVLDILGIKLPPHLSGRSLAPAFSGRALRQVPAFLQVALTPRLPLMVPNVGTVFAATRAEAVRSGKWKYIRTSLSPPCVKADTYLLGLTGINPAVPVRGTPIPPEECRKYQVEALYEVRSNGGLLASEKQNLAAAEAQRVKQLRKYADQTVTGQQVGEEFKLSREQKEKLKSLGYLEK